MNLVPSCQVFIPGLVPCTWPLKRLCNLWNKELQQLSKAQCRNNVRINQGMVLHTIFISTGVRGVPERPLRGLGNMESGIAETGDMRLCSQTVSVLHTIRSVEVCHQLQCGFAQSRNLSGPQFFFLLQQYLSHGVVVIRYLVPRLCLLAPSKNSIKVSFHWYYITVLSVGGGVESPNL